MHLFQHIFWQHIKSRAIVNEHFAYKQIFASNSDVQGFVVFDSLNIQFIFYEIQVIGCMDSSYQMFHGFLLNICRYISSTPFIRHFDAALS